MASKAHAFFCFEVLSASFTGAEHPSLETVLNLYDRVNGRSQGITRSGDQPETQALAGGDDHNLPQLPSIARLQAGDTSSQSSSSSPTSVSLNSSSTQLSDPSVTADPSTYASRLSLTESYPLFITWNTLSRSGNKSLRGCIGTFEALPLEKGLTQYTLTSAFEDTRFAPIPASQLSKLSCSLTLLADFEDAEGPFDWTLGIHGIRISFTHHYRRHGATYLPDVAVEQGWTQEEALESLMRKAGWEPSSRRLLKSSAKPWEEVKDFRLVRYTGLKASASYAEWEEWRAAVAGIE